jgi:hypothetical protein
MPCCSRHSLSTALWINECPPLSQIELPWGSPAAWCLTAVYEAPGTIPGSGEISLPSCSVYSLFKDYLPSRLKIHSSCMSCCNLLACIKTYPVLIHCLLVISSTHLLPVAFVPVCSPVLNWRASFCLSAYSVNLAVIWRSWHWHPWCRLYSALFTSYIIHHRHFSPPANVLLCALTTFSIC